MRSWIDVRFIAVAACIAGATACSDDDSPATGVGSLQPDSGAAGSSGSAGSGGSGGSGGTASSAGTGGRPVGGGGAGGVSSEVDAGALDGGSEPAADGGVEPTEPDAGVVLDAGGGEEPPPAEDDSVTFAELFPVLQASCGGCHSNGVQPQFTQANQAAAYAITQGTSDDGDLFYEEMVELAVEQGLMPPACGGQAPGAPGCLSVVGAAQLQAWVDEGAPL